MPSVTPEIITPSVSGDDPLMWVSRLLTKANSIWLKFTYPFDDFGREVSVHYSCEIRRCYSHRIRIGDSVLLDREVWLNVPIISEVPGPSLIIGKGSNIGRRSVISAVNGISIHENVLFAPGVFVTDHNHEYSDPERPISEQGTKSGGRIVIERNCWLGYGSMILAGKKDLIIGRNSVVGAYSVVTESCPSHSVLVGNPARVVKRLDPASGEWVRTQDKRPEENK
jgi:acetyltransferase-like isoleucine patch superfamily enzyme